MLVARLGLRNTHFAGNLKSRAHGSWMTELVEQEATGRMATARLSSEDGMSVDLLIASSGI